MICVTKEKPVSKQTPAMQVITIKPWGASLPWAWAREGKRDTLEGAGLAHPTNTVGGPQHARRECEVSRGLVSVEAGIMDILDRMKSGRCGVSRP